MDTAERLLARARDLERRRLATALAGVTSDRLTALRRALAEAATALSAGAAPVALDRARTGLDELLDRFRLIARGVYPMVLREHGPFAALDELAAGLPRRVVLTGGASGRLEWAVESGLYHPAAAAVAELAGADVPEPLRVHLARAGGRLTVRIDDGAPDRPADQVAAALADEAERLAALGGDLTVTGHLVVHAWMPDGLGDSPVAAARRAAVAEMDAERRAIERDLHDGAQHHLVSLRLGLGLVEHAVATGEVDTARDRLAMLADQVTLAEVVLAQTAAGLSPTVLVDGGLAAALAGELAGVAMDVEDRRFPAEVEAAVYFSCLEAVGNARRHAAGATVAVTVRCTGGVLRFDVRDDGPGFDRARPGGGRGLGNIAVRMAGVGGAVAVRSAPGAGTSVTGTVPLMPA